MCIFIDYLFLLKGGYCRKVSVGEKNSLSQKKKTLFVAVESSLHIVTLNIGSFVHMT